MEKVVPIHQAKTQLSKLIKEATKGAQIFIGSFGEKEVQLVPVKKTKVKFGLLRGKFKYSSEQELIESDPEIVDMFSKSALKEL